MLGTSMLEEKAMKLVINSWSVNDADLGDRKAKATLVSLEQSLEPAVRPPKALEGLVKGM